MEEILILGLILFFVIPAVLRVLIGLGNTFYCGPLPLEILKKMCYFRLYLSYWIAASCALGIGAMVPFYQSDTHARYILGFGALFIGLAVASVWVRLRLRSATYSLAGPSGGTTKEQLFPSDRLAMKLTEARVPPLPVWWDFLVLSSCIGIAFLCGRLLIQ